MTSKETYMFSASLHKLKKLKKKKEEGEEEEKKKWKQSLFIYYQTELSLFMESF